MNFKSMILATAVLAFATPAFANDRSTCTLKDATPADGGFANLKVQRPTIGAPMQGYRIEAQMENGLARLSAADAELKVASVSTCKDESGQEAIRWLAYSKATTDGQFDEIVLPIAKTAKGMRLRSCSNIKGAQCFSAVFDGDFTKPVVLVKEQPKQAAK